MKHQIGVGNVAVTLTDKDRIVQHMEANGGLWEPETLTAWADAVVPQSTVLDVGGYSGIFSISAMKLGAARAVALEPVPSLVEYIKANAKANGVKVDVLRYAASDRKGKVVLHHVDIPFSAGASIKRKSGIEVEAKAIRLDDLALEKLSAIKIDVEGHETQVLSGARELIKRFLPALVVEVMTQEQRGVVCGMLESYGYRPQHSGLLDGRNVVLKARP